MIKMAALSLKLGKLDAICAKLKCGLSTNKLKGSNTDINNKHSINNSTGSSNGIEEQSVPVCHLDSVLQKHPAADPATSAADEKRDKNTEEDSACDLSSRGSPESNNNNKKLADYNESYRTTPDGTPRSSTLTGSGRKKSRKSSTPRSIPVSKTSISSEYCDEKDDLSEYEINNQSRDLSSLASSDREMDDMEDDNSASFDSSRVASPNDFDRSSNYDFDETQNDVENGSFSKSSDNKTGGSPLDLSLARNNDDDDNSRESLCTDFSDREMALQYENSFEATTDQSTHSSETAENQSEQATIAGARVSPDATEVMVLQDYANNTMNELLSIYGFGGSPEPLTKQIPLKNFSRYQKAAHSFAQLQMSGKRQSDSSQPAKNPVLQNGLSSKSTKGLYSNLSATAKLAHLHGGAKHRSLGGEFSKFKLSSHIRGPKLPLSGISMKSHSAPGRKLNQGKQISVYPDYTKYFKRFSGEEECSNPHCKDLGYRDHYHCLDCNFKVFVKKEEMVRHFKWHRKREDSLQHGFLRFSPMDDCSKKYNKCTHNGRQTHYHCIQNGCDKVYISTSDVQMHANYHRKDSAIIQEGFQRFRATEDCGTPSCSFYGQRTTHFHCRRATCNFTFKNKADMEKHKSYHQKDEVLSRDGFKKFMKYEHCSFNNCRYSKISNHIHCIRPGCNYVLHSTAQLYSHKRRHERRDFENAYRNFRQVQRQSQQQQAPARAAVPPQGFVSLQAKPAPGQHPPPLLPAVPVLSPNSQTSGSSQVGGGGLQTTLQSMSLPLTIKTENGQTIAVQNVIRTELDGKAVMIPGTEIKTEPVLIPVTSLSGSAPAVVTTPSSLMRISPVIAPANGVSPVSAAVSGMSVTASGISLVSVPAGVISSVSLGALNLVSASSSGTGRVSTTVTSAPAVGLSPTTTSAGGVTPVPTLAGGVSVSAVSPATSTPTTEVTAVNLSLTSASVPVNLSSTSGVGDVASSISSSSSSSSSTLSSSSSSSSSSTASSSEVKIKQEVETTTAAQKSMANNTGPSTLSSYADVVTEEKLSDSLTLPIPPYSQPTTPTTTPTTASAALRPLALATPTTLLSVTASPAATSLSAPQQRVTENWRVPREKDEAWRTYLIRYTANDPCNSRCQYLYKDHYHCRVDGCVVLFRSKDGVREHAKFHEIQDRITPLVYVKFEADEACPQSCQFSLQEKHYHCNWTGCSHEIPATGPAFARLEHYRIHEYAKASIGKIRYGNSKQESDLEKRRRGRPPKFPKGDIPNIPKVELPNDVIAESVRLFVEGKFDKDSDVINGFQRFREGSTCPDPQCQFYQKEHFHCARPRCHHATDRLDVLNLHAKDFHNFVNILEGFEFFDRNVDCRRVHCHNNRANRHFHCMVPKCDYSFVRHSTMAQHDKKHRYGSATSSQRVSSVLYQKEMASFVPIVPTSASTPGDSHNSKTVIKPAGTFYPVSPAAKRQKNSVVTIPHINPALSQMVSQAVSTAIVNATSASAVQQPVIGQMMVPMLQMQMVSPNTIPLASLLKQKGPNALPQPNWASLKSRMHFGINSNCGRPFCKLKKRDHYHCLECNQAFSDPIRLRMHVGKHGIFFERSDPATRGMKPQMIAPKPSHIPVSVPVPECGLDLTSGSQQQASLAEAREEESPGDDKLVKNGSDDVDGESSPCVSPACEEKAEESENNVSEFDVTLGSIDMDNEDGGCLEIDESFEDSRSNTEESPDPASLTSRRSSRKRTHTRHDGFVNSDTTTTPAASASAKQRRLSSPRRPDKDDTVPSGYVRYWYNEDCGQSHCAYRQSVTHFHCSQADCGYGFSDRSRMVQHTLRHKRLSAIMGDEFQQFRVTAPCGRSDCELTGKSSHFHCLRCPFVCADSSKVMAHRKYHVKEDNVSSHGFQKYTGTQSCGVETCTYYRKQTHYHCTFLGCNRAVLGPAQFAPHKLKHSEEELN